jgi:hypothetical protein
VVTLLQHISIRLVHWLRNLRFHWDGLFQWGVEWLGKRLYSFISAKAMEILSTILNEKVKM